MSYLTNKKRKMMQDGSVFMIILGNHKFQWIIKVRSGLMAMNWGIPFSEPTWGVEPPNWKI